MATKDVVKAVLLLWSSGKKLSSAENLLSHLLDENVDEEVREKTLKLARTTFRQMSSQA